MAIDTRDKRASALAVLLPVGRVLPEPDAGPEDAGDRQQVAYSYRGMTLVTGAPAARQVTRPANAYAPTPHDWECYRGEDVTLVVPVDGLASLAGWQVSYVLKSAYSGDPLVTRTVGDGITLDSPAPGSLTVSLASGHTNRPAGEYKDDVARTNAGARMVLVHGKLTLRDNTVF